MAVRLRAVLLRELVGALALNLEGARSAPIARRRCWPCRRRGVSGRPAATSRVIYPVASEGPRNYLRFRSLRQAERSDGLLGVASSGCGFRGPLVCRARKLVKATRVMRYSLPS